jgi:predicted nucleotide-binding protein (sugar kinase/HSP70/actin superfamily)
MTQAGRILKSQFLRFHENRLYRAAGRILVDRHEPEVSDTVAAAAPYLTFNIGGEVILSLGRAIKFVEQGAALVVNASPFGCMAGTISAALFARVEKDFGIPVVNPFYEGSGDENRRVEVFLANLSSLAAKFGPPQVLARSRFLPGKNRPQLGD